MSKTEHFIYRRQHVLQAIARNTAFDGTDLYEELYGQVVNEYVRLTDSETVHLAAICRDEKQRPARKGFAADLLARNALPVALRAATEYAPRFGGLLEAFEAAIYNLSKHIPKEKSGWNPTHNGIRWLTWVRLKLNAELPKEATRTVDERIGNNAPATIASARQRLMYGEGNDAGLRDELRWGCWTEDQYPYRSTQAKHMPGGRKNLVVKKGQHRITRKFMLRSLPGTSRNLCGKAPLGWSGTDIVALPLCFEAWPKAAELHPSYLPLNGRWIAAAARANARALLSRPGLSERTRTGALRLLTVGEEWVARHSKAMKLDALIGEEQDERLSDIIPAVAQEAKVFEVAIHHADATRAITAFKRYGVQDATTLMKLPVRQLLPVQATRQRERAEREQYRLFLGRYGIQDEAQAAKAALHAAQLTGCSDAPIGEIKEQLRGIQAALRGGKLGKASQFGQALAAAVHGTSLHVASPKDHQMARQLQAAYPGLKSFPLAVMIAWQRRLSRHGRADRNFVNACVKAGVRIKEAELALAKVKAAPLTQRAGERVRVRVSDPYVRPWQLELERHARIIGARADVATPSALRLEQQLKDAERTADSELSTDAAWLQALDVIQELKPAAALAREVADGLAELSDRLEEAATTLNATQALQALMDADPLLDLHEIVQTPGTWWAQAYHQCREPDQEFKLLLPRYRKGTKSQRLIAPARLAHQARLPVGVHA